MYLIVAMPLASAFFILNKIIATDLAPTSRTLCDHGRYRDSPGRIQWIQSGSGVH